MRRRLLLPVVFIAIGPVFFGTGSCNRSNSESEGLNSPIIRSEKPVIDSSKVLQTGELYRASRYSDLQSALADSVKSVHKLVLYGQNLGILSPEIGQLSYLATFDVAYNELTSLPEEITALHYLQGFYANGNRLSEFPQQILLLPLLSRVDLSENQISEIPSEIMMMDQLVRLSMDKNVITRLPVQLYELKNLEILELKENGLSTIPVGISNLTRLRKLDLAHNQLSTIPGEITTMSNHLKELNLQGNSISQEEIGWLIKAMPETQIRY